MEETQGQVVLNPSNKAIENVIAAVGDLPASPAIVSTVMGLTSDLNSKVEDVSKVLSADQSLTAKVLKLSNSSFYGRPKGVKTLQEAIMILGFFTVRSMVIATSAHSMYMKEDTDGSKGKLWQHSLSTAVTARQLATRIRHPQKDEVFIAGLLHDIGKLVMIQKMPTQYAEIIKKVETEGKEFLQLEHEHLEFGHDQVAQILLEKWSFPESLIIAIKDHHNLPEYDGEGPIPVAYVINLADQLAKKIGVGFKETGVENVADIKAAQLFGLDESDLEEIIAEAKEHYQAEVSIFEES